MVVVARCTYTTSLCYTWQAGEAKTQCPHIPFIRAIKRKIQFDEGKKIMKSITCHASCFLLHSNRKVLYKVEHNASSCIQFINVIYARYVCMMYVRCESQMYMVYRSTWPFQSQERRSTICCLYVCGVDACNRFYKLDMKALSHPQLMKYELY